MVDGQQKTGQVSDFDYDTKTILYDVSDENKVSIASGLPEQSPVLSRPRCKVGDYVDNPNARKRGYISKLSLDEDDTKILNWVVNISDKNEGG